MRYCNGWHRYTLICPQDDAVSANTEPLITRVVKAVRFLLMLQIHAVSFSLFFYLLFQLLSLLLDPRFYLFDHGVELLLALFVGLGVDVVGFALDRSYTMTAPKDFYRILKQQDGEVTAFSEKLLCGLTDYATVYADDRLTFTFKKRSAFEG